MIKNFIVNTLCNSRNSAVGPILSVQFVLEIKVLLAELIILRLPIIADIA